MTEWIGLGAAFLTTLCYIPQAWRVIRIRETHAISLPAYLALFIGVSLWLVYGLLITNWPVILANGITLPLILVILVMKIRLG